jgi:cold shock CspA family protein
MRPALFADRAARAGWLHVRPRMPLNGTLRSWNDDRGYGFIAPRDGGREIFVHVSAFPRDGSRPTVGESLVYELGSGKDGKPQAVRVYRQALGKPSEYPSPLRRRSSRRSPIGAVLGTLLVAAVGAYGYKSFSTRVSRLSEPTPKVEVAAPAPIPAATSFRCDGRTHCSQMTSCEEATYFLRNCPGTQMDGNNDGVPCEKQWCTGPFAR